MKDCPYCAHKNMEGVLFCDECGQPLLAHAESLATSKLVNQDRLNVHGRMTWGTAHFNEGSSILFRVRDHDDPIQLIAVDEILLGRSDAMVDLEPDLDLALFGAAEQGVSRRHALIRRGEDTLTLIDLESTNGTYLNGQRLIANQPRVLRDGDEIRMGRLVLHIFFK